MSERTPFPPGLAAVGKQSARLLRLATYRSIIIGRKPVSYWRLREETGTLNTDAMQRNPSILQGGYTLGVRGPLVAETTPCVKFNGTTGYSSVQTFTGYPTGGAVRTVEAWFNYLSNGGTIFAYGDGAGGGQDFNLQVFNGAGTWYLFTDGLAAPNNLTIAAGILPRAGVWHHLVFTLTSATTYKAYLNGRLWKEGTFGGTINTASPTFSYIGNRADAGSQSFNGSLAEVAIYDDIFLEQRAYRHYRAGLGFFV